MKFSRLWVGLGVGILLAAAGCGGGGDGGSDGAETYEVTGAVELGGAPWTGGGTAVLSGEDTRLAHLDASGAYAFREVPNGAYTVRVYLPNQSASPLSREVVVAGQSPVVDPFALVTYSLSGRVTAGGAGQEGVPVTLGGAATAETVTGLDGSYAFSGLPNGTYSVRPVQDGRTFTPASRPSAVLFCGDAEGVDFAVAGLPEVETLPPADLTADGATLRQVVNPGGSYARAWFEWSTDPALAYAQETPHLPMGEGSAPVLAGYPLLGLSAGVTYYYRAVAENAQGTVRGGIDFFSPDSGDNLHLTVNSVGDEEYPDPGKITLRSAVRRVDSGGTIDFAPALDGATIPLRRVGEAHTVLKGEVFTFNGRGWDFQGYQERDYGRSALYAAKSFTLDAEPLPHGVTLAWTGGDEEPARVLAVYGDLTLRNVTVTGGFAKAEPLPDNPGQPFTLARGGGLAVWGVARLERCTLGGNRASGDLTGSRDRGAFGGGLYADIVALERCVVSGNAVSGYGAAGGGVYSVGGVEAGWRSTLKGCTVSGNRVTGEHAYGGGVYSDGGGPGNLNNLDLTNCTVARNVVEDNPDVPESNMSQYYTRGGGLYMSNGYLSLTSCTVVENEVTGIPHVFGGKPNLGGGGLAATIGNAHVVEDIQLTQSIVAGNRVYSIVAGSRDNGASDDVYTGSLLHFYSYGYNLLGTVDFTQMLVPIPEWSSLSRRHYPKVGDQDGVALEAAVSVAGVERHPTLVSQGVDRGEKAVLWYPPAALAIDAVPPDPYNVPVVYVACSVPADNTGSAFLYHGGEIATAAVEKLRTYAGGILGETFGTALGDVSGLVWSMEGGGWPADPLNVPWIKFWHDVDAEIGGRLGAVRIGDDFWGSFETGPLGLESSLSVDFWEYGPFALPASDQRGRARPAGARGDVGAVEQ